MVRLATSVPFAEAAELIQVLLKVEVDDETVRRLTERAGKAAVAVEEKEREGLVTKMARERTSGGVLQLVSVDGAMVRTREEGWTEVKTLAIGQVARSTTAPTTNDLGYFSRLADHRTFSDLAHAVTDLVRRRMQPLLQKVSATRRDGCGAGSPFASELRRALVLSLFVFVWFFIVPVPGLFTFSTADYRISIQFTGIVLLLCWIVGVGLAGSGRATSFSSPTTAWAEAGA